MIETDTHERPALFSKWSINRILANAKNQTRRIVIPQPQDEDEPFPVKHSHVTFGDFLENPALYIASGYCRYGKVGDIIWVRETWKYATSSGYRYRADGELQNAGKWKSAIYMPKHAARIFLKITDIQIERLQEMNEADAKAEGIASYFTPTPAPPDVARFLTDAHGRSRMIPSTVNMYASLWDSLNKKQQYKWNANPYVWVITFRRIDHGQYCKTLFY